ncbi:MAG: hypothetical protein SVY10_07460, partial [Thermodesulfobacteriota bacterium]|nr:hypothetical protein [Thermodesulfobacteriota bacterium]
FEKDYSEKLKKDGINKKKRKDYATAPFRTQCYDAVALIALAIEKAGPGFLKMSSREQGKAIAKNMRSIANPPGRMIRYNEFPKAFQALKAGKDVNYQGVSGPITLDKNGDIREAAIVIWHVKDGKTLTVWTVDVKQ